MRAIRYVQYANPAALPPLEHSALLFLRAGYRVSLSGLVENNEARRLTLPPELAARARLWHAQAPGWRQKLHYLAFIVGQLWRLIWLPRGWVYASDLLSCPVICLAKFFGLGCVIYHEHDSVDDTPGGKSRVDRALLRLRGRAARCADIVILPNEERAKAFDRLRPGLPPARVVWNCPRQEEAGQKRTAPDRDVLRVLYHGSVAPERLPLSVIEALARFSGRVRLSVVGYFPVALAHYADTLRNKARDLGVEACMEIKGAMPRAATIAFAATQDVGLAFMPKDTRDINMRHMTGASNKAFDYLAVGAALLVSDLPDWQAMYVNPGYAFACDPNQADSVAAALEQFLQDPERMRGMGERGRQRILAEWNYETQFAPVLHEMERITNG